MATWVDIADSSTDPDAPLTSELAKAWTDNVIAAFEGAAGAPRFALKSIERVVAGAAVRSSRTGSVTIASGFETFLAFNFIQIGTVRATMTRGGAGSMRVVRLRAGGSQELVAETTASISVDIPVIPGDRIQLEVATGGGYETFTARFLTDGGNLWPGSAAVVEGNDV